MVALYSSATRLSFFKFLSVLWRRDKAIGLVSGSWGLSSFQGTAIRYLPFSYTRESFTLLKASLSSSVSTSLYSRSVPDFSISRISLGCCRRRNKILFFRSIEAPV